MLKRGFDLLLALSGLILLSPLAAIIAILVRLKTLGPSLTSRICVGQHGKHFRLHHFRTMTVAAPGAASNRPHQG